MSYEQHTLVWGAFHKEYSSVPIDQANTTLDIERALDKVIRPHLDLLEQVMSALRNIRRNIKEDRSLEQLGIVDETAKCFIRKHEELP